MKAELVTLELTQVASAGLRPQNVSEKHAAGAVAPATTIEKVDETTNSPETQENADSKVQTGNDVKVSQDDIKEAISDIKDQLGAIGRQINISVDDDLDIVVIKVINKDTEEVVRQIPSERLVEIAKTLEDNMGLLLQEEA